MKTNIKKAPSLFKTAPAARRVAGGMGAVADKISPEQTLRRCVLTNLLWEDQAYESGVEVAKKIRETIPLVAAEIVAGIAIEARELQKLRHVPLFIVREMARLPTHKHLVASTLAQVVQRPDELSEFLALYWKDGRCPLSHQVKKGLAAAFGKFDAYQLAKWDKDGAAVKLRDVAFLVHAKPADVQTPPGAIAQPIARKGYKRGLVQRHGDSVLTKLVAKTLEVPDTWETELSASKDKQASWERLLTEKNAKGHGKLGALAFIRNLRNLKDAGVDKNLVRSYFTQVNPERVLPFQFLAAVKHAPEYTAQLESLMLKCLAAYPKLTGKTVFVVDVSGSMGAGLGGKSEMTRLDAAAALTALMREVCEDPVIYVTAGNDGTKAHATAEVAAHRGFALMEQIRNSRNTMGGGGIFLCQATKHIENLEKDAARLIVLSDSQDMDYNRDPNAAAAFGEFNYLFDVAAHTKGVAYKRFLHIDGWSEHVIDYIYAIEAQAVAA